MSVIQRCPSYRGVHLIEVSVKRESTVKVIPHIKEPLLHFSTKIYFNECLFGPQISSWSRFLIILAVAKCVAFLCCIKDYVTDCCK